MSASPDMRNLTLALLLPFLLGCVGAQRMDVPVNQDWQQRYSVLESMEDWDFTGRIAVRDDQEAHNSRIRWRQRGEDFVINLWGALNIGATEIVGSAQQVRLQQERQEPLITNSPEELIREQLGYELPVENLRYWIKGIPAPGQRASPTFNEHNQLTSLRQSGWQIEYLSYTNYALETLPTQIRMEKQPLRLEFIMRWTVAAPAAAAAL
jgi:outer membrane lipoprotein LolB